MIVLRNPLFLIALLLVPAIWWAWLAGGRRPKVCFSGLSRLKRNGEGWSLRARHILPVLRSLAVVLLVLSLARPQKADEETRVTTEGIAIQLVVDRSGSMDQEDFVIDDQEHTRSRLQAVKDVVEAFVGGDGKELEGRPNDLIGMIAFARWPDTECPLTRDHSHLIRALRKIETPKTREESFTAIGDALLLATERIKDVGRRFQQNTALKIKSRVIILLTDGEQNAGKYEPIQAAEAAAALGVKVYTIGAAPEFQERTMGGFMFQPQKVKVPVEVDEQTLMKVAEMTGGKYFRAKDRDSLKEIYAEIDRLERSVVDQSKYYQYEELAYKWIKLGAVRLPPPLMAALSLLALEAVLANTRFRRIP
jgi:Ca-activated chloride channel family protein